MISDWECLEILMHSMKDPQWVKYLPFKNDLYGAVFQVLIWKYRERLLVNSSQTGRGLWHNVLPAYLGLYLNLSDHVKAPETEHFPLCCPLS